VTSRIEAAKAWSHTHQGRKLIRFTSVSVISTAVSYLVIFVVYELRWIPNEVYATIFGNAVATVPSYQLNRNWTWGKHGRSHLVKEVIPFWSLSGLGISVSVGGAFLARHLISSHPHWAHLFDAFLLSSFNVLSFAIFWVLKLWLFNRIFKLDPLASIDAHLTSEEHSVGRPTSP
jgi:putative flippase GtrA